MITFNIMWSVWPSGQGGPEIQGSGIQFPQCRSSVQSLEQALNPHCLCCNEQQWVLGAWSKVGSTVQAASLRLQLAGAEDVIAYKPVPLPFYLYMCAVPITPTSSAYRQDASVWRDRILDLIKHPQAARKHAQQLQMAIRRDSPTKETHDNIICYILGEHAIHLLLGYGMLEQANLYNCNEARCSTSHFTEVFVTTKETGFGSFLTSCMHQFVVLYLIIIITTTML